MDVEIRQQQSKMTLWHKTWERTQMARWKWNKVSGSVPIVSFLSSDERLFSRENASLPTPSLSLPFWPWGWTSWWRNQLFLPPAVKSLSRDQTSLSFHALASTHRICSENKFALLQGAFLRNVDKCNTVTTPNQAITTAVTTTKMYEYTDFFFRA